MESESNTDKIAFCKENRRAFSLRKGVNQLLRGFPINIRHSRCKINPHDAYGYETEPFLIDFYEEIWGGRPILFWRFEIRQRALFCDGRKGDWETIDEVLFQEDPGTVIGQGPNGENEDRLYDSSNELGIRPYEVMTPMIQRTNSGEPVFGITEDPEISGKQFEAKIRARIEAIGDSITTTSIYARCRFSNSFKVERGTILHRDQLPPELFGANSGLNDYTYFEIVNFKTTSDGAKWDGTSFDVPISNVRIQTTVMTVKPSSASREGSPDFGNYTRQRAVDRISSGLKSSIAESFTAPSFVRDASSAKGTGSKGNGPDK